MHDFTKYANSFRFFKTKGRLIVPLLQLYGVAQVDVFQLWNGLVGTGMPWLQEPKTPKSCRYSKCLRVSGKLMI